ncbi:MAG: quinolinate synthase NadA [Planctomycetaceae bacterium]|jgi:quinolinate synthase|nr:quinolinate synthase NadA [Planctomycetaceae bacterium]
MTNCADNNDVPKRIRDIRRQLEKKLLILGHHYQRDEVLAHTDLQGDSYQLSAAAGEQNGDLETIVFCGVHFMAETADILVNSTEKLAQRNGRRVNVLLPDLEAGCGMADMATLENVERCWNKLGEAVDLTNVVPVTYVNSTADLKAFCGRHGGYACTSSNAVKVLSQALSSQDETKNPAHQRRVLFFPDQHLGRNTALTTPALGIGKSEIVLWDDTAADFGGNTEEQIVRSKIILWNGYCCVHQKFVPEHIETIRETYPNIRVIVHPECRLDVVEKADAAGSTAYILRTVNESPAGSIWAVGTEGRFVERLAKQNPDKTVVNLAFQPSYCDFMGLIELPKLAAVLESVVAGQAVNIVSVPGATAAEANECLKRMLQC